LQNSWYHSLFIALFTIIYCCIFQVAVTLSRLEETYLLSHDSTIIYKLIQVRVVHVILIYCCLPHDLLLNSLLFFAAFFIIYCRSLYYLLPQSLLIIAVFSIINCYILYYLLRHFWLFLLYSLLIIAVFSIIYYSILCY